MTTISKLLSDSTPASCDCNETNASQHALSKRLSWLREWENASQHQKRTLMTQSQNTVNIETETETDNARISLALRSLTEVTSVSVNSVQKPVGIERYNWTGERTVNIPPGTTANDPIIDIPQNILGLVPSPATAQAKNVQNPIMPVSLSVPAPPGVLADFKPFVFHLHQAQEGVNVYFRIRKMHEHSYKGLELLRAMKREFECCGLHLARLTVNGKTLYDQSQPLINDEMVFSDENKTLPEELINYPEKIKGEIDNGD